MQKYSEKLGDSQGSTLGRDLYESPNNNCLEFNGLQNGW